MVLCMYSDVCLVVDYFLDSDRQGYENPEDVRDEIQDCVQQFLMNAEFPTCREGDSRITVPLIFE